MKYENEDPFDSLSISLLKSTDCDWMAAFVKYPNISAFGDTVEEALSELKIAWKAYKESCLKHGDSI